jgi:hypothetical protein
VAPNARQIVDRFIYTTNERAYRSLRPYTPDPPKYTVLAIGDSFTFGIDTNDAETWPHLLEARDPRLNVINLGVGGHGIDQMDVTLQETIGVYRPDLVIVAFISDDLRRTFLSFRDYKKPRFVLHGDGVLLANVPVGLPDDVAREIKIRRHWLDHSYTFGLLRGFTRLAMGYTVPPATGPLPPGAKELDTRLFDQMREVSRQHGAEFLLVYLSYGEGLFDENLGRGGRDLSGELPRARASGHLGYAARLSEAAPHRLGEGSLSEARESSGQRRDLCADSPIDVARIRLLASLRRSFALRHYCSSTQLRDRKETS